MGVIVSFNYNLWTTRYPEFAVAGVNGAPFISPQLAQMYFDEATTYQANNGAGPIADAAVQLRLLNMLTAHIAALNMPGSSPLVGRIANASEGSVSVSTDNQYPPGTPQWYQQTKYGAAWWAATAQYRTMRYRPGPVMGVPANQGPGWWGANWGGRFNR